MAGLLDDMPSRGTLMSVVAGSCRGRAPPSYVCDHETSPPEGQVLKHDKTNVIVRALQHRREAANSKASQKSKAAAQQKGKGRAAVGPGSQSGLGKRPHPEGGRAAAAPAGKASQAEAGTSSSGRHTQHSEASLQGKTVKELTATLSSLGLPTVGKKPELIKRILQRQRSQQPQGRRS